MYGRDYHYRRPEVETFTGTLEFVSDPSQLENLVKQPPPYRGGGRGSYHGGGGGGFRGGGFGNFNKFIDMNKPWVSQDIRNEIWKKVNLANIAKKSKTAEDVAALQAQAEYVEKLLANAKFSWLASNPELEKEWLGVLAEEERTKTYFCDVCEKLVGTESEYKVHLSEHATCGIDGCGYTAHQDILEKHIMHQHLTGLYNRIAHGDSPEEIAKWREERKKNFPTKEKVEEKEAERAVLKERGEVMWLKREKLRREERERRGETEEKKEEAAEWQCNCKARHFVKNLRGRGRGGRGRNFVPRNIKHQSHCRELELIRERAKEKKEKRQALWEERKQKRKACKVDEKTDEVVKKVKIEKVQEDDSCSEDEGWNGGLWKFPGTKNLGKLKEKNEVKDTPENKDKDVEKTKNEFNEYKKSEPLDTSDDEAPVEVKTVVSYENVVEESHHTSEKNVTKKHRKRKRKTEEDAKVENISEDTKAEEVDNELEIEPVSSWLSKYVDEYTNPPVPGEEEKQETDENLELYNHSTNTNITEPTESFHQEQTCPKPVKKEIRPTVFDQRLRPPTLLEKLLLNEIKKERNKILQCVRFVCKNNFFQDSPNID